jgi:hypothetical protein
MSNRKDNKINYDDRARTRQVTHGPPALSTKTKSQWDGVSLDCFSSSSSYASKVTPLRYHHHYETPTMAYGENRDKDHSVINLCKFSSSEDFKNSKKASVSTIKMGKQMDGRLLDLVNSKSSKRNRKQTMG